MKFWRKQETAADNLGIARLVLSGAPRREWCGLAIRSLLRSPNLDRIGIWLAGPAGLPQLESFEGLLWDRDHPETSPEWSPFLASAIVPADVALRMRTVEQALQPNRSQALFGHFIGLHRLLWVPLANAGHLHGILLLGARDSGAELPRAAAESLASDLSLALVWEESRRQQQQGAADLNLLCSAVQKLGNCDSHESALQALAGIDPKDAGVVFCGLAFLDNSQTPLRPVFQWTSGDAAWLASLESEPIRDLCKKALESRQMAGAAPPRLPNAPPVERAVALPIYSGGETLGVMIAGVSGATAGLAGVERLERRAQLAGVSLSRYLAQQKERRLHSQMRSWVGASSRPVLLLDARGTILAASPAARDLFETQLSQPQRGAARTPFLELFAEADRERLSAWLTSIAADTSPGDFVPFLEMQIARAAVNIRSTVAHRGRGWVALVLERLTPAALASERAEVELHGALEWLDEGVVVFDAENHIRSMNIRFAQMANLTPDQAARSTSLESLIAQLAPQAADPDRFAAAWRASAANTDSAVREEWRLFRPVPRVLERAARPILDVAGRHLGRVEIFRDLTAHRAFQSKLVQTEKLAALGQTMTGVIHELSNPLTTILGYAQRLLLREISNAQSQDVRQIVQEAERASRILRQVLVSARDTPAERRRINLNELVQRSIDLQRFALASQKIKIELALDPLLPQIEGDAGQLQQVILNLVGNARQALEHVNRAGTLAVRTALEQGRVVLHVQDDGPGIPESIQARIFDPFFTTKPSGVGTGLGLAIVLGIVREHGGGVHLTNAPNGGAHFRIELPVARLNLSVYAPPTRADAASQPLAQPARPQQNVNASNPLRKAAPAKRILVVEDEPIVARLVADILEDEGMHVEVLLEGRSALERAERDSFDLVLCDMKMPGLDGPQFFKTLLRAGNPLASRILFITGDVIGQQTRAFLEQFHLPHLAKPFRVEELLEKTHQFFQPAKATAHAATRQGNT